MVRSVVLEDEGLARIGRGGRDPAAGRGRPLPDLWPQQILGDRLHEVSASDDRGGVPRNVRLGERIGHYVLLHAVDPVGEGVSRTTSLSARVVQEKEPVVACRSEHELARRLNVGVLLRGYFAAFPVSFACTSAVQFVICTSLSGRVPLTRLASMTGRSMRNR